MKKSIAILFLSLPLALAAAEQPTVTLAPDGFPTGQDTPEGAATDFLRAFISLDMEQFQAICLPRKAGETQQERSYNRFLDRVIAESEAERESGTPHPKSPRAIGIVFAARDLSHNGPSSYGYARHNYSAVQFVDAGAWLNDNTRFLNRTLVVQTKEGKWYVHPCPDVDPLLSLGLNQEEESTIVFREKYGLPEEEAHSMPEEEADAPEPEPANGVE